MSYVMPFGKYKGRLVSDIPSSYLEWLTTIDLSDALQEAVVEELRLRDYGYSDDPGEDKDDHAQDSHRKQTSHSATQVRRCRLVSPAIARVPPGPRRVQGRHAGHPSRQRTLGADALTDSEYIHDRFRAMFGEPAKLDLSRHHGRGGGGSGPPRRDLRHQLCPTTTAVAALRR
jgi:hypothetical protein